VDQQNASTGDWLARLENDKNAANSVASRERSTNSLIAEVKHQNYLKKQRKLERRRERMQRLPGPPETKEEPCSFGEKSVRLNSTQKGSCSSSTKDSKSNYYAKKNLRRNEPSRSWKRKEGSKGRSCRRLQEKNPNAILLTETPLCVVDESERANNPFANANNSRVVPEGNTKGPRTRNSARYEVSTSSKGLSAVSWLGGPGQGEKAMKALREKRSAQDERSKGNSSVQERPGHSRGELLIIEKTEHTRRTGRRRSSQAFDDAVRRAQSLCAEEGEKRKLNSSRSVRRRSRRSRGASYSDIRVEGSSAWWRGGGSLEEVSRAGERGPRSSSLENAKKREDNGKIKADHYTMRKISESVRRISVEKSQKSPQQQRSRNQERARHSQRVEIENQSGRDDLSSCPRDLSLSKTPRERPSRGSPRSRTRPKALFSNGPKFLDDSNIGNESRKKLNVPRRIIGSLQKEKDPKSVVEHDEKKQNDDSLLLHTDSGDRGNPNQAGGSQSKTAGPNQAGPSSNKAGGGSFSKFMAQQRTGVREISTDKNPRRQIQCEDQSHGRKLSTPKTHNKVVNAEGTCSTPAKNGAFKYVSRFFKEGRKNSGPGERVRDGSQNALFLAQERALKARLAENNGENNPSSCSDLGLLPTDGYLQKQLLEAKEVRTPVGGRRSASCLEENMPTNNGDLPECGDNSMLVTSGARPADGDDGADESFEEDGSNGDIDELYFGLSPQNNDNNDNREEDIDDIDDNANGERANGEHDDDTHHCMLTQGGTLSETGTPHEVFTDRQFIRREKGLLPRGPRTCNVSSSNPNNSSSSDDVYNSRRNLYINFSQSNRSSNSHDLAELAAEALLSVADYSEKSRGPSPAGSVVGSPAGSVVGGNFLNTATTGNPLSGKSSRVDYLKKNEFFHSPSRREGDDPSSTTKVARLGKTALAALDKSSSRLSSSSWQKLPGLSSSCASLDPAYAFAQFQSNSPDNNLGGGPELAVGLSHSRRKQMMSKVEFSRKLVSKLSVRRENPANLVGDCKKQFQKVKVGAALRVRGPRTGSPTIVNSHKRSSLSRSSPTPSPYASPTISPNASPHRKPMPMGRSRFEGGPLTTPLKAKGSTTKGVSKKSILLTKDPSRPLGVPRKHQAQRPGSYCQKGQKGLSMGALKQPSAFTTQLNGNSISTMATVAEDNVRRGSRSPPALTSTPVSNIITFINGKQTLLNSQSLALEEQQRRDQYQLANVEQQLEALLSPAQRKSLRIFSRERRKVCGHFM